MTKVAFTHPALYCEITDTPRTLYLPAQRIICPECNGYGSHFRRDLDENMMLATMREEGDWEGLADYDAGDYNEVCHRCDGRNVVDEINWDYFRAEYPEEAQQVDEYNHQACIDAKYEAHERRMLGGY